MFRSILLAALVLAPGSALAQTDSAILDSIPLIIGGVGPDAPSKFGPISVATTTRTGPGTFTLEDETHKATIAITEPEPCIFEMAITTDGKDLGIYRVDANRLHDVVYDRPSRLSSIDVEFKGEEGALMVVVPDGRSQAFPAKTSISSDADVEDMRAAVAALKAACPSR